MIPVSSDVRDSVTETDHSSGHGAQRRSARTVSGDLKGPGGLEREYSGTNETGSNPPGKMVPDPKGVDKPSTA